MKDTTVSDLQEFFLNEKPVLALTIVRKKSEEEVYGRIVSQEIDTTYAHTVKILSRLEDEGLLTTEKKGRKKILKLTDNGEEFADEMIELLNLFNQKNR